MRMFPDISRFRFGDLFIEFLGSLVPGFLFTFLAVIALVLPVMALYCSLSQSPEPSCEQIESFVDITARFRFETIFFGLVFSYVAGFCFFRQDPKLVDEKSVWMNRKVLTEREHAAVWADKDIKDYSRVGQKKGMLKQFFDSLAGSKWVEPWVRGIESFFGLSFKIGKKIDVQFPYKHIKEYLDHRGLKSLARLIDWGKGVNDNHRTKAFINLLKVRSRFAFPEKCGHITRNEAHVRLMSSMWYMSRSLQLLAMIGLILAAYSVYQINSAKGIYFLALLFPLIIFLGTLMLRHTIEKYFHYQRVREIIYVLATADFADRYEMIVPNGIPYKCNSILDGLMEHDK